VSKTNSHPLRKEETRERKETNAERLPGAHEDCAPRVQLDVAGVVDIPKGAQSPGWSVALAERVEHSTNSCNLTNSVVSQESCTIVQ
jgi:hypothetical protein